MERFGLLGQRLRHSYSPQIHSLLASYEYKLYEVEPDKLASFLATTDLDGMNVTIPYKKAVMPHCAGLSDAARRIGSVNTLLRRDGDWYGENTDYHGFLYQVRRSGIEIAGKKALVLGNGGVAPTVRQALRDLGAAQVVTVSRRGPVFYENLPEHRDAGVIVNTTPVGMYPNNGESPVDLALFDWLEGVLDLIYNPARTGLLCDAEERGVKTAGGLGMLVAQAKRASELFTGRAIDDARVEQIAAQLSREMQNLILIGMPGCGKTTVGRLLAERLGRPFFDADAELVRAAGRAIPEIFDTDGEAGFRQLETQTLRELGKRSGAVIATGGGCVTRRENYRLLHQNGIIVWLKRPLDRLSSDGRPLSQRNTAEQLYRQRREQYAAFADLTVENDMPPERTVQKILEAIG